MQVEDECNNGEGRLDGLGAVFVGLVELVAEVVDRLLVAFAQTRLRRLVLHRHQLEVLLHLLHLVLATTTDLRLTAHDARVCVCFTANKSDRDLFCKLCAPTHALNHLLPPARNRASLRTREHSYQLPEYSIDLHKKSFLIRSLGSFICLKLLSTYIYPYIQVYIAPKIVRTNLRRVCTLIATFWGTGKKV